MTCSCGVAEEWGGEQRPDNGRICWDCGAFSCVECFAKHDARGTKYADRDLCPGCNISAEIAEREAA